MKRILFRQLLILLSAIMILQVFASEIVLAENQSDSSNTYPVNARDKNNNTYQKILSVRAKKGSKIVESIKLESYSANKSSNIKSIFPRYKIYNNGNTPVKLSDIKIRYYYTINGESSQNFWCDWSNIGNGNVVGRLVKIPAKTGGVDYCLEITFKEGAGLLKQKDVAELQCRIQKSDGTEYIQQDDYSFDAADSSYADWSRVTAYINDKLVYGTEPVAAPQNINITALPKNIVLNWDAAESCTGYEVEADGVLIRNIAANTYSHTGLIPGTRHTYRVRLRNAVIAGPWSQPVTGIVPISDKFNITQTVSESAISLSWDKIEGAAQYFVEVDGEITDNGQQTSYHIEGLQPGTKKSIRIQAKGDALLGEWSELTDVWTLPDIPANITTTASSSAITLNWKKVTGATGYDVEVYGTPEDNSGSTTYTQNDLQANSQRTYRVRAKNSSGAGQWSEVVAATTLPDSALNMQAQASDNEIRVTWNAQAGALAYEFEIDGSKTIEIAQNEYIDSDLQPNTEHTYRARPKNGNGTGEWSAPITAVTLLPRPDKFQVASASGSAIALNWDSVQGATGYDIEADGQIIDNGNKTGFVHGGLGPNEEHTYRVRARNEKVSGNWTDEVKKSTLLPPPKNLKVTASGNEVKLEWDMVVGADGYGLEIDGREIRLDSNTEYTWTALEPGVKHTYRVRAYKGDECGEWGDSDTKTTMIGKPSNMKVTTQSSILIDIAWDSVEGAAAYDVMADGKVIDNGDKNTYTHTDLSPNTPHTYMVRAKDKDNIGEWTNKILAYTNVATPAAITAAAQSKTITITWDEVDGADVYDIMADGNIIDTSTNTAYKHTGLLPDTKHSYRIRAKNANGMSEWSQELVQLTGPEVPVNFKADAAMNQVTLTWETTTSGAIGFDIEADGEIIKNITGTSCTITGLEPGTRHEYRIRSKNEEGVCSEWSKLLEVNTTDELTVKVEKDTGFNFVIAVPKKEGIDSYDIIVNYNADDVEVLDLYAATQKAELETGSIEGTGITIKQFSKGKIVYGVTGADKAVITIVRFMSKTGNPTKLSYIVE